MSRVWNIGRIVRGVPMNICQDTIREGGVWHHPAFAFYTVRCYFQVVKIPFMQISPQNPGDKAMAFVRLDTSFSRRANCSSRPKGPGRSSVPGGFDLPRG